MTFTNGAQLRLDAAAVENLLKHLGEYRAMMQPEVQPRFGLGQSVIFDPRWATEPELMLGNSVLHLRDPRYGWVHYAIPRDEARRLGALLQGQSDNPPTGPRQEKSY